MEVLPLKARSLCAMMRRESERQCNNVTHEFCRISAHARIPYASFLTRGSTTFQPTGKTNTGVIASAINDAPALGQSTASSPPTVPPTSGDDAYGADGDDNADASGGDRPILAAATADDDDARRFGRPQFQLHQRARR